MLPPRIACLGDSNTYGYDPQPAFGGRYPYDVRWTGRLEAEGFSVFNCGQNGLTIPRPAVHGAFADLLRSLLPLDLVTVMLGTNDILLGGETPADAADAMEDFLGSLSKCVPASSLLLIAPPQLSPGFWVENARQIEASKELAAHYRLLAEKMKIHFADAGEWGVPLAYDGVHFSEEGHRVFAEKLTKTVREITGTSSQIIGSD